MSTGQFEAVTRGRTHKNNDTQNTFMS